jgi:hypothetical protein
VDVHGAAFFVDWLTRDFSRSESALVELGRFAGAVYEQISDETTTHLRLSLRTLALNFGIHGSLSGQSDRPPALLPKDEPFRPVPTSTFVPFVAI